MKRKHDNNYDFSGWATKANILCSDGRTIMPGAFLDCDGVTVPLVWNHQHDSVENVLGHALLEDAGEEGVRVYGYFNDDEMGRAAKERVNHKDITNLSIYANKLKQNGGKVMHGIIREVSLVLAGANPGAVIDSVLAHSDDSEEEAIIYTNEEIIVHAEEDKGETMDNENKEEVKEEKSPEKKEKTGNEVFATLNDEQKTLVYALVGAALEEGSNKKNSDEKEDEGEEKEMKHNVFDNDNINNTIALNEARKEFEAAVIKDAKAFGSMKESFLAHSENFQDYLAHSIPTEGMTEGTINRYDTIDGQQVPYGIGGIDLLFPEAKAVTNEPEFIRRKDDWVGKVMSGVKHSPFSRIKSLFADITEDEARAKGYITGNLKKNEVFTLLKRATDPQTVYKKQKLDRDDVIDITDFDVVRYMKKEMRWMLDEEIAGAILFGDGRDPSSDDKIQPIHVHPIAFEAPLFNVAVQTDIDVTNLGVDDVASETAAKLFIRNCIRARKKYRGSGNPKLYMGEDLLTECLLLEDGFGHLKYDSVSSLASTLRVSEIVPVPLMDERTIVDADGRKVLGIIVNLNDYTVGADKGGEINMFDDFDIDYNQMKYLIETRISGALTKPFSALTIFGAEPSGD